MLSHLDLRNMEKLKHYVYLLLDPRDEKIFYIGKGSGDRIFHHERVAESEHELDTKSERIRSIKQEGKQVQYYILRHGLDEPSSLMIESSAIDLLTICGLNLSNKVKGFESRLYGLRSLEEVLLELSAPPLRNIGSDCVIINVNNSFSNDYSSSAIYNAVKAAWRISKKRIGDPKNPLLKYVLAEHKGNIVAVFHVREWFQVDAEGQQGRWGFDGEEASKEIKESYIGKRIEKKKGAANPILFNL